MRNLKFKSPPTVAFYAAVNHNLNICTPAINGPWKTETYKNNKMDRNPPITAKDVTFWPRVKETWKNRNLQNGSKSANHSEERDALTPLNSFYSFSKTTATLIHGSENATVGGDLNFRFRMLLKGAVITSHPGWIHHSFSYPSSSTAAIPLQGNVARWVPFTSFFFPSHLERVVPVFPKMFFVPLFPKIFYLCSLVP